MLTGAFSVVLEACPRSASCKSTKESHKSAYKNVTSNKCLTSSNKDATRNKCIATSKLSGSWKHPSFLWRPSLVGWKPKRSTVVSVSCSARGAAGPKVAECGLI